MYPMSNLIQLVSLLKRALAKVVSFGVITVLVIPLNIPFVVEAASTIFSDGFESGSFSKWTNDTGEWEVEHGGAHGGSKFAEISHDTGSHDDLLSKTISTVGYKNLTLNYWYKIAAGLESNDRVVLEWTTNGTTWNTLTTYSNINSTSGYAEANFTLPQSAESAGNFQFRFRAELNISNPHSQSDSFKLDDVNLLGDAVPPENTLQNCSDSSDNDLDGSSDLSDTDCAEFVPKLKVTKVVINNDGGNKHVSDFPLFVGTTEVTSGLTATFAPGSYIVSETNAPGYEAVFSGACDSSGNVTLAIGDSKTCTITNSDNKIEVPVCPFVAQEGRTIVTFETKKIYSDTPHAYPESDPAAVSLVAGTYAVTLYSFDGYFGRELLSQAHEEWFVNFKSGLTTLVSSVAIGDLADNVLTADKTEVVNTALVLPAPINYVTAYHAAYPQETERNSVYPVCAAFDLVAPALQCVDGIDNDDDGTIDSSDPGCVGSEDNDETDPIVLLQCTDGIDNDGDELVDLVDPGCANGEDNDEVNSGDSENGDDDTPPVDMCPNIDGAQETVPTGHHLAEGQCVVDVPVDLCPNISDTQITIPEGYHLSEGQCILDDTNGDSGNGDDEIPTDVCPNIEGAQGVVPTGYHLGEGQCILDDTNGDTGNGDDDTTPTDVCPNIEGIQESVPTGFHLSENQCVADETTGGSGNGDDTTTTSPLPPSSEPSPSPSPAPLGNGPVGLISFGGNSPFVAAPSVGQVLGAQTCSTEYLKSYIKPGAKNDPEDVKKLQSFLNETLGLNIPLTGFYGPQTIAAVKKFQVLNSADILRPWVLAGLHNDEQTPTGYVYKTTKRKVNLLKCPELNTPLPDLSQG